MLSLQEEYDRQVEGGVILIGRQSLKGYMEGLRKGWFEQREDESWISTLNNSIFDDPLKAPTDGSTPPPSSEPEVSLFPLTHLPASKLSNTPEAPSAPAPLPPTPSPLPAHPSMLLLPYHPDLGFSSIPRSIASFFNTTADVKLGGDAAMAFILGQPTDAFAAPSDLEQFLPSIETRLDEGQGQGQGQGAPLGLDFDLEIGEARIPKNFEKSPAQIDERMASYYTALTGKVAKAWELKNGRGQDRCSSILALVSLTSAFPPTEPTEAELKNPPATLEKLQEDRIKKERRAREDRDGYRVLRKGSGVTWDERFRDRWSVWDPSRGTPDW